MFWFAGSSESKRRISSLESAGACSFSTYVDLPEPGKPTSNTTFDLDDVAFRLNQPCRNFAPRADHVERFVLSEALQHREVGPQRVALRTSRERGSGRQIDRIHGFAREYCGHLFGILGAAPAVCDFLRPQRCRFNRVSVHQ